MKGNCEIYVDGSFIDGSIGYGAVVLIDGEKHHEIVGSIREPEMKRHRQVGGELQAVLDALDWAAKNGISSVGINYDYEGIASWPTGKWKANLPMTRNYAATVRSSGVQISWKKVKAHSGNKWNDYVDLLAKKGAKKSREKGSVSADVKDMDMYIRDFMDFIDASGIKAHYAGKINESFYRVEFLDDGARIGMVDIYQKKNGLSPDFRGFRSAESKAIAETLWKDFKKHAQ